MAQFPGDRAGQAPGAMGLTGKAGLQLSSGAAPKKFGLQRSKAKLRPTAGFDDADEEPPSVAEEMQRMHSSKHAQAAARAAQTAALAEDASVYDYDGVFDTMQAERQQQRAAAQPEAQRKTRYIGAIMETHKDREIENDKVFERKLAKEAEAEAHLYGDKEKFLTSSYRRKLQVLVGRRVGRRLCVWGGHGSPADTFPGEGAIRGGAEAQGGTGGSGGRN